MQKEGRVGAAEIVNVMVWACQKAGPTQEIRGNGTQGTKILVGRGDSTGTKKLH